MKVEAIESKKYGDKYHRIVVTKEGQNIEVHGVWERRDELGLWFESDKTTQTFKSLDAAKQFALDKIKNQ